MEHYKTSKELDDHINDVARSLYKFNGYEVSKGFDFRLSSHPQEKLMWHMAVRSFEAFTFSEYDECVNELNGLYE